MVAVMAGAVPPAALIPVHGVVQLGSNLGRVGLNRRHVRVTIFKWFALGAVIGIGIGASVAVNLPRSVLQVVVAVFVLVSTWAPKLGSRPVPERGFVLVGAVTSFVTMFVGATGPFLAPFLSPQRLGDRLATVGTFAACMRSEEHTSELQSLMRISYAVFCLKKKKKKTKHTKQYAYTKKQIAA